LVALKTLTTPEMTLSRKLTDFFSPFDLRRFKINDFRLGLPLHKRLIAGHETFVTQIGQKPFDRIDDIAIRRLVFSTVSGSERASHIRLPRSFNPYIFLSLRWMTTVSSSILRHARPSALVILIHDLLSSPNTDDTDSADLAHAYLELLSVGSTRIQMDLASEQCHTHRIRLQISVLTR